MGKPKRFRMNSPFYRSYLKAKRANEERRKAERANRDCPEGPSRDTAGTEPGQERDGGER
ncbi:hypothetical protein DSM100685_0327 [Bifidobacterium avesanii]|nr:hypothetical protein DSM100685_0327 [Bifidobacterium avesanii]